MIFLSKKWLITAYDNSLTEYHVYFGSFQRLRHALSCSKHLPYIWQTCRHYVRCTISVHEDTDAETVKWKCSKLKVKLISKNHEASKCASCEITESNPKKFMLAFIGYTIRITQIYSQTHTPTWLHIRTYKFTGLNFWSRLPFIIVFLNIFHNFYNCNVCIESKNQQIIEANYMQIHSFI